MQHKESVEQQMLFQWAELAQVTYPQLKNLIAVPNGGKRNAKEAARLKAEGVKAGFPDVFLFYPSGMFCGLAIELKADKNKPTALQKEWLTRLAKAGYSCAVCWSFEAAQAVIQKYLNANESAGLFEKMRSGDYLEVH